MSPSIRGRSPRPVVEGFIARPIAETWTVEANNGAARCRNPADNMPREAPLAAAQEADDAAAVVIVSDDRDPLVFDPWRDIRVVKPEAAVAPLGIG